MGVLEGKRAVITGSSMGIGKAVAARFAREGARIVINARNEDALEATRGEISAAGGVVQASAGTVADYDYAARLIKTCVDSYGGIDVLVNCAGIAEPYGTSILNIDPQDWQALIDVHLHGTFNTCRHAAPVMVEQGRGRIINTSSHAFLGLYGGTGYAAAKGATNSLSTAMAVDLKGTGVETTVVCPGARTRLSTGDDFTRRIESLHASGALSDERRSSALNPAEPDYVASLYALLASDLAAGLSGHLFWASGGYLGVFRPNGQELLAAMDAVSSPPWEVEALWERLQQAEPGL